MYTCVHVYVCTCVRVYMCTCVTWKGEPWRAFLEIPETIRAYFGCHNFLCILKMKTFPGIKFCNKFTLVKDQLSRISRWQFQKQLFGPEKFLGLLRNGPLILKCLGVVQFIQTLVLALKTYQTLQSTNSITAVNDKNVDTNSYLCSFYMCTRETCCTDQRIVHFTIVCWPTITNENKAWGFAALHKTLFASAAHLLGDKWLFASDKRKIDFLLHVNVVPGIDFEINVNMFHSVQSFIFQSNHFSKLFFFFRP